MPVTHAKNVTIADWSGVVTVGNSTGGTVTDQASNLARPSDWNSAHAVNLTASEVAPLFTFTNGLSSSTAAGGISVGIGTVGFFENQIPMLTNSTMATVTLGSWYFDPAMLPFALSSGVLAGMHQLLSTNFLNGAVYSAASTGSITRYQTLNNVLALYQLGSGTATTRLSSIWSADASTLFTWERRVTSGATDAGTVSNYLTASFPGQFNVSGGVTYSSTSASGTVGFAASTGESTIADALITGVFPYFTGSRYNVWPFATTLPAGAYWMANMLSSTSSSTGTNYSAGSMATTLQRFAIQNFNAEGFRKPGQSVSNATNLAYAFQGALATTTSAPTSIAATSDFRRDPNPKRIYWQYAQTSY